jgi:predicted nuclease with TOPRIM domain
MKQTKKQLVNEVHNLRARDKAWIKDYNKLQKKLDKADLEIYNLKMDKSNLQNEVSDIEYKSSQYKEERDINANDIEHVKYTKDHMELQYLKQIVNLQNKVINNSENASTSPYVNGAYTITT